MGRGFVSPRGLLWVILPSISRCFTRFQVVSARRQKQGQGQAVLLPALVQALGALP